MPFWCQSVEGLSSNRWVCDTGRSGSRDGRERPWRGPTLGFRGFLGGNLCQAWRPDRKCGRVVTHVTETGLDSYSAHAILKVLGSNPNRTGSHQS